MAERYYTRLKKKKDYTPLNHLFVFQTITKWAQNGF